MTDTLTVTGLVATEAKRVTTQDGLDISSFRLASTSRRYDKEGKKWIDGDTNWYTVLSYRALAINVYESIAKGQRVIVTGRLRLRLRDWENNGKHGISVEIEADAIGHDLSWGTSTFHRRSPVATPTEDVSERPTEATSPASEGSQA